LKKSSDDAGMTFTLVDTANEADRTAIEQGLIKFNSERTPYFAEFRTPENTPKPLDVVIRG
jgi:hypothetical protein